MNSNSTDMNFQISKIRVQPWKIKADKDTKNKQMKSFESISTKAI